MEIPWLELFVLVITTFVSIFAFIKWNFKYWAREGVPYLEPTSLLGNFEAPWAIKRGFHFRMMDIYNEFKAKGYRYGGAFSLMRPVFIPIDLELLKCIMIKDFQHFPDRGTYYNEKTDPLSAHLFRLDGDKWRSLRTRLRPTFTSGKLKNMFQTVLDCGDDLEKEIDKLYLNKKPVDIKETAALFTTNVIGSCAFGLELDAFANPDNEFRTHNKNLFKGGLKRLLTEFAILSFPKLCRRLGVKILPPEIAKFYMDLIKEVTDARESGAVKRNDFIQLLVDIKNGAKRSEDSFTFNEIAAQAFIFFLGGFETSSSTMTFAFYELARNQDIQDKVREEVRAVIEKHGGKITYDGIMEMTYLTQVFEETLRKYPIVAVLDRIATSDYKVPGEDLVLKKGTKVLISLKGIHHDPEYYPDPQKFDPDRFTAENKLNRHICAYMPFGEGPRICIGMRFGIIQAKMGMSIMLKNHRYKLSPKMPEMQFFPQSPLLTPIGKMLLDIERVD